VQQGEPEGGEVQLDEEEIHETTRTIMTMMMIVMVGVQLVEVEEDLPEEGVGVLVREVPEVEGEVPMQLGRGGLVMVSPRIVYTLCTDEQTMAMPGHVHVGDKLLFGLLGLRPRTRDVPSIHAQNPRGRHAVSL